MQVAKTTPNEPKSFIHIYYRIKWVRNCTLLKYLEGTFS